MLRFLFFSVHHFCRPAEILLTFLLLPGRGSVAPEFESSHTDHHEQMDFSSKRYLCPSDGSSFLSEHLPEYGRSHHRTM